MKRHAALLGVVFLLSASGAVSARQAPAAVPRGLVGTWRLVSHERADGSQPLAAVPNPIGILIQDAKGNVIEIVTRAGRAASIDLVEQFMTYQAFWGSYSADQRGSVATYRIRGDLDPGRTGRQMARAYELKGNRLVLTESSPANQPSRRTTWERVAELEALPDYQRDAVGFWQWQSAGLVDNSGKMMQPASRDESVIVYTPTGLMAVLYLPPPGRKAFADSRPTLDEARTALQGAPTYFGPYIVQPKSGSVTHYQIAIPNPGATGNALQRNFEVKGDELILRFPPTTLNGQQVRNIIHLKRLGGLTDMWPEFRR
jgi:hypothetical protein